MSDNDNTRNQQTVQVRVKIGEYWLLREWGSSQETECPKCGGEGEIGSTRRGMPVKLECPKCGGSGRYTPPWSSAARDTLVRQAAEALYPGKSIEKALEAALKKARRKGLIE